MSLWEYKVITSGRGGFATPVLMEKFLNDLGKEDWEIVAFHTQPDNMLAFTGLARRTTQRDWTLQDAAAAAAKAETDKLRLEFEAKFKNATASAPAAADERPESVIAEKVAPEDGLRKLRDTERDGDPEAQEEEGAKEEWDKLGEEEELPSFFEAMRPHMRRNQRGAGMSVGVDYLSKKWDFSDADVIGALKECGFTVPDDEDAPPAYVEFDGDLFWININRRGELWINTKEKPRPVFRTVKATPFAAPEAEAGVPTQSVAASSPTQESSGGGEPRAEAPVFQPRPREAREPQQSRQPQRNESVAQAAPAAAAPVAPGVPLPAGAEILDKVRPLMRRNRRGPGGSGSMSFLARALRVSEGDLLATFAGLGLVLPATPADKPVNVEIGEHVWWMNQDQRGGLWINGREKGDLEPMAESAAPAPASDVVAVPVQNSAATDTAPSANETSGSAPIAETPSAPPAAPAQTEAGSDAARVLSAIRLLLKETKTGGFAGKLERVAEELSKSPDELLNAVVAAGLKVPEKSREKPVFVEHGGEIFWLNKNAKEELWLNAKVSKFADKGDDVAGNEGGEKKNQRRGGGGGGGGRAKKKVE